jgi:hypothetical protein
MNGRKGYGKPRNMETDGGGIVVYGYAQKHMEAQD